MTDTPADLPPAPDEPFGALCWRNWKEHEPGAPPAFEATLYSDAMLTGGPAYRGIGPYTLFNTIALRDGELGEALVIRGSWHLPEQPYAEPRPLPKKPDTESWLGLELDQEIAALLAVFLGVRVWSGGITREFRDPSDPAGSPVAFAHVRPTWQRPKRSVLPHLADIYRRVALDDVPEPLARLPALSANESVALVRAARLYQMAIWVADSDPESAWLQLVSAVEVAASHWRGQMIDPADVLDDSQPELAALLRDAGGSDLFTQVAAALADLLKSTNRFLSFMTTFAPNPPAKRCDEAFQVPWEELKKRLNRVYDYRSKRLHAGEPFPAVLNQPPLMISQPPRACETPPGAAVFTGTSEWPASAIPMYLWLFEYIVRGALLRWFKESLGAEQSGSG